MGARFSTILREFPFWAVCALIPLGIFAWYFHWQVILPTRVTWLLQGDWGTHVLGWNALRHDDWRWPLGLTKLLAWPTGANVAYTDSAPLIAILLKPFSRLLPASFQFTGVWLLACVMMQFISAFILLRPHARIRLTALVGAALLTLMPTLLIRVGHPCLFAQWTILLSLHAFINVEQERRRDLWYGAILLFSALIHPYLLLMNASIWGSDVLRRSFGIPKSGAYRAFAALGVRTTLILLGPVVAIWATAGLGGYKGGAGGFGYYSMSLDALFNPGLQGYSRLLPARPQGEGQIYEGFQYLGFGLLCVVAASVLALVTDEGRSQLRRMGWLLWLTPAMFVLTALAISDDIQFDGRVVAHIPYDWVPFDIPAMFRASGRLFWPCAYALVVAVLQIVFALPRAFPLVVSLTALGLQASDLTGFAADIRSQTKPAALPEQYVRTPSPLWEPLVRSAAVVEFQPPVPYVDIAPFYEIAWRATSQERAVNISYTARIKPEQEAFERASRAEFIRGVIDTSRLYVLLDGCVPEGVDKSLVRELDGLLVIPPAAARNAMPLKSPEFPLSAPAPIPGRHLDLSDDACQKRPAGRD